MGSLELLRLNSKPAVGRSQALAGVLLVSASLVALPALAEPVAMVLDASEGSNVAAFTELADGETLDLGTEARVELLDYRKCQEIAVTGGKISVTSDGVEVEGGELTALRPGKCIQSASVQPLPPSGGALAGTEGQAAIADATSGGAPLTTGSIATTLEVPKAADSVEANAKAASVLLRFDGEVRARYDNVFVSVDGGAPRRFSVDDPALTELPAPVGAEFELRFEDVDGSEGVEPETRHFTLQATDEGRSTSVILVK